MDPTQGATLTHSGKFNGNSPFQRHRPSARRDGSRSPQTTNRNPPLRDEAKVGGWLPRFTLHLYKVALRTQAACQRLHEGFGGNESGLHSTSQPHGPLKTGPEVRKYEASASMTRTQPTKSTWRHPDHTCNKQVAHRWPTQQHKTKMNRRPDLHWNPLLRGSASRRCCQWPAYYPQVDATGDSGDKLHPREKKRSRLSVKEPLPW